MSVIDSFRNLLLAHPAARDAAISALVLYRKALRKATGAISQGSLEPHLTQYNQHRNLGPRKHLCFAPLSNLYFGTTGRITACCFNRHHVLGVYPNQSIQDAWEGLPAKTLRSAIASGDFSLGCQGCETLIRSGNYASVNAQTYDYFEKSRLGMPSRMDFELSNTCNLACVMCNGFCSSTIRKEVERRGPLHSPYDAAFISELKHYLPHLRYAKFLGGEPFLIPLYYTIWDNLVSTNQVCQLYVQTNATQWNSRIEQVLNQGLFSIGISLDSLKKDQYERIRVHANFNQVMDNIAKFAAYCQRQGTRLSLTVCPMRYNLDELPEILSFANALGAALYFNVVYEPHNASVWNLPSIEIAEWISRLSEAAVSETSNLERKNSRVFYDFIHQLKEWKDDAEIREGRQALDASIPIIELKRQTFNTIMDEYEFSDLSLSKEEFSQLDFLDEQSMRAFLTYPTERILNVLQLQTQQKPKLS